MKRTLLALLLAVIAATPASAQKRCAKGIPCGNSCISASKMCRIGNSAPTPKLEQAIVGTPDSVTSATSGDWVGSSRGTTYYKAACSTARRLSPSNLIYFKSEGDAKKAGYHRSASKGC